MKRSRWILVLLPLLLATGRAWAQGADYIWEWDEALLHGYPDGTRIAADFSGGNTTSVPDGFLGQAGDGWLTDWALAGNENVIRSAAVEDAAPLADGGAYLAVRQRHSRDITRGTRVARRYGSHDMLPASIGVRRDRHHSVQFLFRLDVPVSEMHLIRFADDVTSRLASSEDTAWEVLWRASTETSGFRFSNGAINVFIPSDVRLYAGDVYAVRIDLDPAASTYGGHVENLDYAVNGRTDGVASFTTGPLGLSGGKTETGGYLNFVAYMRSADAQNPERHGDYSIDRLGIVPGPDAIVPGERIVDPPTLENLGFRWFVEGDRNGNATVEVAYRKVGEPDWREAMPLLRINHEIAARYQAAGQAPRHFRTANLFAGSVMFLDPGTAYEVRFTMQDPDGGAPGEPEIVTVSTRAEPQAADDGRMLHVYPPGYDSSRETPDFDDIPSAFAVAVAGDVIFLHEGTHPATGAPYVFDRGGEPGRPIVLRGAGADRTVVEGPDRATDLFRLPGADYLVFEDLTLRTAHTAIHTGLTSRGDRGGPGASWLTVRRSRIEDVINGIWTYSENSRNWYIADNIIEGIDEEWYPRPTQGYMDGSHTGVNVYGQGHVVCHNRISRFSDSLAIANYHPPLTDIHRQAVNIDFYNNDLSFAVDDTIEADYGCHNVRVYRNLCYNTHTALSIQPSYGGPIYLVRNVAFGITSLALKWNMHPSGPIAWHNTLMTGRRALLASFWGNGHLHNNLLLGGPGGGLLRAGTYTPEISTMDYNGWYGDPSVSPPIDWTHGRYERHTYASLEALAAATGLEANGIRVDANIFLDANPVEEGVTYSPGDFDLRLKPGAAAVDAGMRLPNINDDFTGSAPDLGAYERDRPRPRYGPRFPIDGLAP